VSIAVERFLSTIVDISASEAPADGIVVSPEKRRGIRGEEAIRLDDGDRELLAKFKRLPEEDRLIILSLAAGLIAGKAGAPGDAPAALPEPPPGGQGAGD